MRKLRIERCINGRKLLRIQLRHNAFQRCLCDLADACRGGGGANLPAPPPPPTHTLTDERPNLLISPMGVGGGLEGVFIWWAKHLDSQPANGGQ